MFWAVIFFNPSTNKLEAVLYRSRAAAEAAVKVEWFKVYDCTIAPAHVED